MKKTPIFSQTYFLQMECPTFGSSREFETVPSSSTVFESRGNFLKQHQSFLGRYRIKGTKKCGGTCPDILGQHRYKHTAGGFDKYPIHIVLLALTANLRSLSINSGYTLIRFLLRQLWIKSPWNIKWLPFRRFWWSENDAGTWDDSTGRSCPSDNHAWWSECSCLFSATS